jgi:hypothetical protein
MQQRMFCVVWLPEGEIICFISLNSSKKSKLPFSDIATFVAWVVFEQESIQLRNNFFLRAENMPKIRLEEYISSHSTLPTFFLAFCTPQKAVDGFIANSAAAYQSFFSFFITVSAAFCIRCT